MATPYFSTLAGENVNGMLVGLTAGQLPKVLCGSACASKAWRKSVILGNLSQAEVPAADRCEHVGTRFEASLKPETSSTKATAQTVKTFSLDSWNGSPHIYL